MSEILLVAESGSDITPELARENQITIVPMHVSFGGQTLDDGSFPVTQMFEHYKKTRELPKTSGCTPHDFEVVFDRLQAVHPGAQILHLAYSASTTCSMQSALIAAKTRKGIVSVDTKNAGAGQAAIVLKTAAYLREHPETTMDETVAYVNRLVARMHMGFFPGDLDYLRAGGRVSNAAYLGATILSLHPLIEMQDGKLFSTKKYRGSMSKVIARLMRDYPEKHHLHHDDLWLIYGDGLSDDIMREAEQSAKAQGFERISWVRTGCVIAAHSGPGSFGIVGFEE